MFEAKTYSRTKPACEVVTRHLEGPIVETTYTGHCDREGVASMLAVEEEVLSTVPGACWLLDMTGVTSLHTDAREPGTELLRTFRDRGGRRFAVAVTMSRLRFLLAAVAYATRLPLKTFPTRAEALEHLRAFGASSA